MVTRAVVADFQPGTVRGDKVMRPLGVALIGYGGIGRVHAMAYRDIPFTYGIPANLVNS